MSYPAGAEAKAFTGLSFSRYWGGIWLRDGRRFVGRPWTCERIHPQGHPTEAEAESCAQAELAYQPPPEPKSAIPAGPQQATRSNSRRPWGARESELYETLKRGTGLQDGEVPANQTGRVLGVLITMLATGPAPSVDVERAILAAGVSRRMYFYVRQQLKAAGRLQAVREGGLGASGRWLLQLSHP